MIEIWKLITVISIIGVLALFILQFKLMKLIEDTQKATFRMANMYQEFMEVLRIKNKQDKSI